MHKTLTIAALALALTGPAHAEAFRTGDKVNLTQDWTLACPRAPDFDAWFKHVSNGNVPAAMQIMFERCQRVVQLPEGYSFLVVDHLLHLDSHPGVCILLTPSERACSWVPR